MPDASCAAGSHAVTPVASWAAASQAVTCSSPITRVTSPLPAPFGAAGPTATLRSDSVTGSPRAAPSVARPRSPVEG